jgi:hypothetical protein
VYWLGWESSVSDAVLALVTAALAGLVGWSVWAARFLASLKWEQMLLHLPRRPRRILGLRRASGRPTSSLRRALRVLLHVARRGRPTPPTAPDASWTPWGQDADVRPSSARTIVAFEWADDEAAARAVHRLTETAANRGRFVS